MDIEEKREFVRKCRDDAARMESIIFELRGRGFDVDRLPEQVKIYSKLIDQLAQSWGLTDEQE